MKLFDRKFVRFIWDDELEGKKCFVADLVAELCSRVEEGSEFYLYEVRESNSPDGPFKAVNGLNYIFAYYDPNYEVKKAFYEGKAVQFRSQSAHHDKWLDVLFPTWDDKCEYRVKPVYDDRASVT